MAVKRKAAPRERRKLLDISQSVIRTWRRCKRKYRYQYIELLETRRPKIQLIRGSMLGECLDLLALARVKKNVPGWETALAKYEKKYGRLFDEEIEIYGDLLGDVRAIVRRYADTYATDGLQYQVGGDGNPFELEVKIEGIVPGVVFVGHIDKYPMDKTGRVWVMDHKSHAKIPDADTRFQDIQTVFYCWAAPLSNLPKPAGVLWDYLRTKPPAVPELLKSGELSQRKNIDTDYDTYRDTIRKHGLDEKNYREMLAMLKPAGRTNFFQRIQLPSPSKALVNNVVEDAKRTMVEIRDHGQDPNPERSIAYDCKGCEFYSLCQAEYRGLDTNYIRKSDFQRQKEPRHDHS